jgi:type I restriction enzyme, S subunit
MKQGWEIKKLGEVCDFQGGSQPPKSQFIYEPKKGYVRFLQIRDFASDKNITYIPESKKNRYCNEEDILLGRYGASVGKVLVNKAGAYNVAVMKTIPNETILYKRYLYYYLNTEDFQIRLLNTASRSAQDGFSKDDIFDFPILIPPLLEQQSIVSILDEAYAAITKAKTNAEQNLTNSNELFESYLQGVFENGNWETKTIEMVCDEIFAGGDAPKNNYSLQPNEKHNIPIYANAVKDRGLYGYTDFARVTKPCVTIAARGSGTGHTELRNEHFLPIVRLIVCIPDTKQISTEFLKYTIDNLVIQRSGSAIPQLTVPMIKDYKIPVPSIEEQKQIIEKAETLKQQKESLENVYLKKIEGLEELKKSILQKAFAGELKTEKAVAI